MPFDQRHECGPEIVTGGGDSRSAGRACRTGAVEASVVDEATVAIDEVQLGGADRVEAAGDLLGFVEEIRKAPAVARGLLAHTGRGVLRILRGVIG